MATSSKRRTAIGISLAVILVAIAATAYGIGLRRTDAADGSAPSTTAPVAETAPVDPASMPITPCGVDCPHQ